MALPAPGNPISATLINIEAQRTGSTNAPLSGNVVPTTTSLVGLYVSSGVNQVAPHKYSEFYSKTYVAPPSPYWFVNTTNTPSIGKAYKYNGTSSGRFVIQDNNAALSTTYNTTLSPYGGSGLAVIQVGSEAETLIIGGSVSSSGTVSGERWPLLTQFDQTAGVPEMSTTYNFTGTVYHWVSDIHILDGSDGIFWVDQEKATDNDGATDRRRYGFVFPVLTSAVYSGVNTNYPELYQYTNFISRIDNSTYQQGYFYSSPKIASVSFTNLDPFPSTSTKWYVYVCNQIKNENLGDAQEYNGGVVRITCDTDEFKGGTVPILSSPIFKVYQQNPGTNGSVWGTSDMTTFADICVMGDQQQF